MTKATNYVDLMRELEQSDDLDEKPLAFGKYSGWTPNEISEEEPSYIVWMYETLDIKHCSKLLYEACKLDAEDTDREEDENLLQATDSFMARR